MLERIFFTGIQLTQVVGIICLLWGAFEAMGAVWAGRGPFGLAKGAALMMFGFYLASLGRHV
jgi:uncharacterized membrane protein HdeD (DUF308 family)